MKKSALKLKLATASAFVFILLAFFGNKAKSADLDSVKGSEKANTEIVIQK